ncbi:MAG TPA: hypothetical protein ENK88_07585 [Campylobacterales bacterium]|nr:hypothetical protein [Campylobacterales bacterium]
MAQVADVNQTGHLTDPNDLGESYHKTHLNLWKDYRHIIDNCRNTDNINNIWRKGINGGIYDVATLYAPDINISSCGEIASTLINPDTKKADYNVTFENPGNFLIGSINLTGNDSRGTRSMKLNATPLLNYTPDDINMTMLWTEGEFASLQDRRIVADGNATTAIYSEDGIEDDAGAFISGSNQYIFEFGNSKDDAVLVTMPLKRTLIQLDTTGIFASGNAAKETGTGVGNIDANSIWSGVTYTKADFINTYGQFGLNVSVYDDSENYHTLNQSSFIVSPASTSSTGVPGEVPMISSFLKDAGYPSGYALMPLNGIPAIVTQMSTVDVNGNIETNWIYSARD